MAVYYFLQLNLPSSFLGYIQKPRNSTSEVVLIVIFLLKRMVVNAFFGLYLRGGKIE